MGCYFNKLDKKYFRNSVYIKKCEDVFNIKIKDYPLQYDIIYDTFNTIIMANNTLFSKNYIRNSVKVDNLIHLISSYLNKYKNKINKCFDKACITQYENLETMLDELLEMQELKKYNFTTMEEYFENIILCAVAIGIFNLYDDRKIQYNKVANDKLPRYVNTTIMDIESGLILNMDKQNKINDDFIKKYFDKTGIDLNKDKKQKDFIFYIHYVIADIHNAIVDYRITKEPTKLAIYVGNFMDNYTKQDISFLEDITYKNLFNKVCDILNDIANVKIDSAYDKLKAIIKQYSDIYNYTS